MAFKPIKFASWDTVLLKQKASTTIAKYDGVVDDGNGYIQRATNAATEVRYVSLQDSVSGAASNPEVLCIRTDKVLFECDTNGNTSQAIIFDKVDLTDHDTLNEWASANDVFQVETLVWAAANKKVTGFFIQK